MAERQMAPAEKTSAIHFDEHTISEFSKIFQTRDNVRGRLHSIDPKTKKNEAYMTATKPTRKAKAKKAK